MTEEELKLIEARAAREGSWFPTLTEDSQDLAVTCQKDVPLLVAEIRAQKLKIATMREALMYVEKECVEVLGPAPHDPEKCGWPDGECPWVHEHKLYEAVKKVLDAP